MKSAYRYVLAAIIFGAGVSHIVAHDGAMGPTKARMDAMSEMGEALKSLTLMARSGGVTTNPEAASLIELLTLKGEHLPALFEARDLPEISEALPSIWERPDRFSDRILAYSDAVSLLSNALVAGDEDGAKAALPQVSRSCSVCHQLFRE